LPSACGFHAQTMQQRDQAGPALLYPDSAGTRRNRLPKRAIEILLRE
jgi:hypothetical protein